VKLTRRAVRKTVPAGVDPTPADCLKPLLSGSDSLPIGMEPDFFRRGVSGYTKLSYVKTTVVAHP